MKSLAILAISFLFNSHSFSQSLAGEWKGAFTDATIAELKTPFALHFTLKKDSTYKVYTYTRYREFDGAYLTAVCEAACRVSADSIFIEELKQVKPKSNKTDHLQKMQLSTRTKDGKRIMEGWWEGVNGIFGGTVLLTRKE